MITWMQRHKKWLVVTIWISVIAFVGAGFVGWGSYDFNLNRTSSVAKVGDEKISFVEFDRRFAQIFSYYQNISNGTLTQQQALEQRLDAVALQSLIEDKLLVNFAKRLGIGVSEDEVLKLLMSDEAFWDNNGSFNKNLYYETLKQNNLKPTQYEQMLTESVLLRKINAFFDLGAKDNELRMLAANIYMQDNLQIEALRTKDTNTSINEARLKELYEENKEHFKTEAFYKISSYFMPINTQNLDEKELLSFYEENKQKYTDFANKILSFEEAKTELSKDFALSLLRKSANEQYLKLAKKEDEFQRELDITNTDIYYPLEELAKAKQGAVLKPFEMSLNGELGYHIIRLDLNAPSRIKSFEEARELVLPLYERDRQLAFLKEEAERKLANLNGTSIGFVNRDSVRDGARVDEQMMNNAEFSYFLQNVFNSDKNSSFVLFDDKAILYKIKAQRLDNAEKLEQYKKDLIKDISDLKHSELRAGLLKELEKLYPVQIYYKGK